MSASDVELILTDIFPRKISIFSSEEADDTIPELISFWQFLGRAYQLPQANDIIKFLEEIKSEFKEIMMDPVNFGMARSIFMAGNDAGYDMTNQEEMSKFMMGYNQAILSEPSSLPPQTGLFTSVGGSSSSTKSKKTQKKKKRKMAKASQKKNRKRRK